SADPAVTPDPAQQPADPIASPPTPQIQTPADQKSPLDILEEILSKEEKKNAAAAPSQETGPTPEELALIEQHKQEQQAMIEEARQRMMSEVGSDEQKKRDAIRQQQMDANKINNPY